MNMSQYFRLFLQILIALSRKVSFPILNNVICIMNVLMVLRKRNFVQMVCCSMTKIAMWKSVIIHLMWNVEIENTSVS